MIDYSHTFPDKDSSKLRSELLRFLEDLHDFSFSRHGDIVVNCAYRSKEFDLAKGRPGTSSHCKGYAVDLAIRNSSQRASYIFFAIEYFKAHNLHVRLGIATKFIHIDLDPDKPSSVWLY